MSNSEKRERHSKAVLAQKKLRGGKEKYDAKRKDKLQRIQKQDQDFKAAGPTGIVELKMKILLQKGMEEI